MTIQTPTSTGNNPKRTYWVFCTGVSVEAEGREDAFRKAYLTFRKRFASYEPMGLEFECDEDDGEEDKVFSEEELLAVMSKSVTQEADKYIRILRGINDDDNPKF